MKSKSYIFLFFCCTIQFLFVKTNAQENDFYTGAVVEYANKYDNSKTIQMNIEENVEAYLEFIKDAKNQSADIIVFPECGLTSVRIPTVPEDAIPYTSVLPDPKQKVITCDTYKNDNEVKPWSTAVKRLSCAARESKIYVVVNLAERVKDEKTDGTMLYNTNIVFDREGAIIAKYRKYNLFGEPAFNVTEKPEVVTFETDFGVTFGTFICFDILFAEPALTVARTNGVTDIVYPTAWFSELPFLTAVQTQAGWARSNKLNLLVSGYNDPQNFGGGSAIFSAKEGILNYFVPAIKTSKLLVAKIPKIKLGSNENTFVDNTLNPQTRIRNLQRLRTFKEDFTSYETKIMNLSASEIDEKVCHGEFCCRFAIKSEVQPDFKHQYMMTAYYGDRKFGVRKQKIQMCGLTYCTTEDKMTCGEDITEFENPITFEAISITGEFIGAEDFTHFPSTVDYNLSPLPMSKYDYITSESKGCKREIELKLTSPQRELYGFGIYGVVNSGANSSFPIIVPLIILAIVTNFLWSKLKF